MNKARVRPVVSIVIPAYNAEKIIPKCLKSIANQTFLKKDKTKVEVILVDDRSSDKTAQCSLTISSKLGLNLKVFSLKQHEERGVARNLGSKRARGDYLLFLDADMQPSKNVITDCLLALNNNFLPSKKLSNHPNYKAVIIPEQAYGEGFWSACRALEKKCYIGNDQIEAARFIETKAFWVVGGWDPTMISGEDWDLTRRLRQKYQITRVASLIYHYEGRLTLLQTARKKYYYGTTALPFWRKNLVSNSYIISMIIRPAYFSKWKLLLSDPIHATGMFILKAVEFSAGAAGLLRSRLFSPPSRF